MERAVLDGHTDGVNGVCAVRVSGRLAFDRRGRLLVLELAERGLTSGDPAGRLVRVEPDGEHTVLARDGLVHPGGIAVAPNGDFYVTNQITGPDGAGQLLRIRVAG